MATAQHLQGTGLGGVLLEAGCDRVAASGVQVVWARARDDALAFYLRHNFEVEGDGFIDDTTQLPHHLVVRHLTKNLRVARPGL
jgi:predicted N-acetyltransferase YhbS